MHANGHPLQVLANDLLLESMCDLIMNFREIHRGIKQSEADLCHGKLLPLDCFVLEDSTKNIV